MGYAIKLSERLGQLEMLSELENAIYEKIINPETWPHKTVNEIILESKNGLSLKSNTQGNGSVLSLPSVRRTLLDLTKKKGQ